MGKTPGVAVPLVPTLNLALNPLPLLYLNLNLRVTLGMKPVNHFPVTEFPM